MIHEEKNTGDYIDRSNIRYYPGGSGGYMYASKGEIDKLPSVTLALKEDNEKMADLLIKQSAIILAQEEVINTIKETVYRPAKYGTIAEELEKLSFIKRIIKAAESEDKNE